ncbi:MAG TPA: NfeD family protein [Actinomycetes bacterium]|jgi:membrane protein implicated in regulation of membrane protease activity|nr:NfeD family protein [Actinomycetes bacterium]
MDVTIATGVAAGLIHTFDQTVMLTGALAMGLCLFTGLAWLGWRAWRAWRAPSILGAEGLVGRRATVRRAVGRTGWVLLDGALWRARSNSGPMRADQTVRVLAVEGLELLVAPEEWEEEGGGAVITALRARWW